MKIQRKGYVVAYRRVRGKGKGTITLTAIVGSTKKECAVNFKLQTQMEIEERAKMDTNDVPFVLPAMIQVEVMR